VRLGYCLISEWRIYCFGDDIRVSCGDFIANPHSVFKRTVQVLMWIDIQADHHMAGFE
jgi:hypothetical protein